MRKHNNNFKQTKFILAFLVAGLIVPGCSSGTGYTVTVTKAVISGTKEKYTFKYYLDGTLDSGFACYCQSAAGGATQWVGSGTNTCSGVSAVSKAITVSGLSVTTDACCKAQPTVNASLPQPPVNPGPSCW